MTNGWARTDFTSAVLHGYRDLLDLTPLTRSGWRFSETFTCLSRIAFRAYVLDPSFDQVVHDPFESQPAHESAFHHCEETTATDFRAEYPHLPSMCHQSVAKHRLFISKTFSIKILKKLLFWFWKLNSSRSNELSLWHGCVADWKKKRKWYELQWQFIISITLSFFQRVTQRRKSTNVL